MRFLPLAAALLAAVTVAQADTRSLTLATGDYVPFTGQELPNGGLVNDIVQQIATQVRL